MSLSGDGDVSYFPPISEETSRPIDDHCVDSAAPGKGTMSFDAADVAVLHVVGPRRRSGLARPDFVRFWIHYGSSAATRGFRHGCAVCAYAAGAALRQ